MIRTTYDKIKLSETTKFIVDNRGKTAPTEETGIALIATNCISNSSLYPSYDNVRYISQETYDTWFRAHPEPGDIIVTNKGSQNGAICLVPDPVDFVIAQDMMALRANEDVIDPLYLFAALRSPMAQWQIKSLDVSGVIPHFKKSDFDKLFLPYPDMPTQKAIGKIYFDFCAKIELNRRMNATLESLARAIFKSWFVDFDPVRINAGQMPASPAIPTTHDPQVLELFPSTFQDSELGPIPEGWKVERFSEHINVTRGLSYKGAGLADEGVPMHNLNSIYEGGGYKHDGIKYYTGEYRDKHEVVPGDLIATNTEQGFEHRLIGCAALIPMRFGETGIYSHHIYRIRMEQESPLSSHYMLRLINSSRWHSWIAGFSNGTTINMLPTDALEMPLLVVPPAELVRKFTELASNIADEIEDSILESESLAAARDALLPGLLSGELPVDELLTEQ